MADSARHIVMQGAVQGCGVRPALARLALAKGWTGSVKNTNAGVEMVLQGCLPDDAELRTDVMAALPCSTAHVAVCIKSIDPIAAAGFHIDTSTNTEPLLAQIPRDRALCAECLREIQDPLNRRYRDPFATCAQCGPRYSILRSMPYDRARTSMSEFAPCPNCWREYHDPQDRRYHAQTVSCPECGPRLWVTEGIDRSRRTDSPWELAVKAILAGKILALRGVGGYQLLADATASPAARRLRDRKRRPAKPFAVMCLDLDDAHCLAELNPPEIQQLTSAENPIVLVRQRQPSPLCPEINPGLADIGLMLPTTALHVLLLAATRRPLICTSGNHDGDPLAFEIEDAETTLDGIADLWMHHNRAIIRPIDDSVVRVIAGRAVTLRAGRGLAPLTIDLSTSAISEVRQTLACGGQQKNAMAWAKGGQAVLGPHIGDLDTVSAQDRWQEQQAAMSQLLLLNEDGPEVTIACDQHPGYFPTGWAGKQHQARAAVWHHHAHILTGMAEHHWLEREVLGVAWDGTGLGPDGTIWGGEILKTSTENFVRVGSFRPFFLPGGEAAIIDLRRTALSLLSQLETGTDAHMAEEVKMTLREVGRIRSLLTPALSPVTSSCGRLFDAAASLILGQSFCTYEGQAAMCLEAACDPTTSDAYDFSIDTRTTFQIDWRPVFRAILSDRRRARPRGVMAMKFHRGLSHVIREVSRMHPGWPVVLQGGVFQNRVLTELIVEDWPVDGPPLGLPGRLPVNDAGLAVGQLAYVHRRSQQDHAHVSRSSRPGYGVD